MKKLIYLLILLGSLTCRDANGWNKKIPNPLSQAERQITVYHSPTCG